MGDRRVNDERLRELYRKGLAQESALPRAASCVTPEQLLELVRREGA